MIRKAMVAQWLLLLLPALLIPAYAIYEDQAGTFDWYKQYVGRPTSVAFVPGKERVYLTTNQNLLASLHTKGGQVAWRRKYTDQDTLEKAVVIQKPALIAVASQGGKYLRAWDALEGAFKWEALVFEGPVSAAAGAACDIAAVEVDGTKGAAVAVAAADKLKLFGAQKGDKLWSADLEQASQGSKKLLLTGKDGITVLAYTPGSADVYLISVDSADGSHKDTDHITAATPLGAVAAVSGSAAAVISNDADDVCTISVADGAAADGMSCFPVRDILPKPVSSSSSIELQLAAAGPGSFSLSVQGQPGVAILSVDGQPKWYADAVAAVPAAAVAADSSATSPLALVSPADDGSSVTVQLLDVVLGNAVVATASVAVPAAAYLVSGPAPRVLAAWADTHKYAAAAAGSTSSKKALKGCRIVLLWSDDQLSLISDGHLVWSREEALASSTANLMIDPPAAQQAVAVAGGAAGLLGLLQDQSKLKRWVRLQVLSVLVQFKLATQQEQEEFLQLRQAFSDNNLPFRDTNGFRKYVVLLTAPGKVFALHSGDGRVMWASNVPTAFASSSSSTQYLCVWKRYHDLMHAPELAVFTAGAKSSAVQVLNGHTGAVLHEELFHHGIEKVIPQHQPVHDGASDQFTFLLVEPLPHTTDPDSMPLPKVHLLPNSALAQQQIAKRSGNLFFWLLQQNNPENGAGNAAGREQNGAGVQQQQTVLRGYGLEGDAQAAADAAASKGLLAVVPAWQVVLPGQLLGLAAKDPSEPVHSYVKVLGDRSLKYRYLNPNLLFAATGSAPGHAGNTSPEDQTVAVTLLNTVTGGVVHQQVHHGCAGPVHAVLSEHWLVYTMRDVSSLRQQVTVIELYDASPHDLSIESVILGRTKHSAALSSYAAPPLDILSQSFYLQHAVKGLDVTQTKQGITTKQLLVRTMSDQVYALDKRFLDPRRPLRAKVTPEEAEERLLPYNEFVVFSTLQYPTLDKQVLNLRGVTVAPAVLESTTLVFCYGSDLFFTRITPAQHFDSLQSDFSYGLLVVALLALVIGSVFARYSSEQTMLKAKWQ